MRPAALALLLCGVAHTAALPGSLFDQLQWRMIGPFRGGRISAVSGVAADGTTFYFGSVGGGVWKTTNAGVTWSPIFDGQDRPGGLSYYGVSYTYAETSL